MARLLTVLLLLLVLGAVALPAVQAQGINMYVIFHSRGGNISEYNWDNAHFHVNRVSLGAGCGHEAHFRLCFSGSATLGVDYNVFSNSGYLQPNGSCVTDKFSSGHSNYGFYIRPMNDAADEPNETVTVTMSQDSGNPFPSGYYFPSRYCRATFRIIDND
ncbi:MAG: hypothetical protein J4G18_09260 [Anaerolineae bacterium]|nr:hypothetical protein [Anaerolineae bacterium]